MTRRLDTLILVRRAAARGASLRLSDAGAAASRDDDLAQRMTAAAEALTPQAGPQQGNALAAQLELAGRIRTACTDIAAQHSASVRALGAAATERAAARRRLDQVVQAAHRAQRDEDRRREMRQTVPGITQ